MADQKLFLVKVPFIASELAAMARRRKFRVDELDEGYVIHSLLKELWQDKAPTPFTVRNRGRYIEAWGYAPADKSILMEHARKLDRHYAVDAIAGGIEAIDSKPMPILEKRMRVGFLLRTCPVVRLSKEKKGNQAGKDIEVDAFLARCFSVGKDVEVSREEVYTDWLKKRLADPGKTGASVLRVAVVGMHRERMYRRTQGVERKAQRLERPDVHFEGDLLIEDGEQFLVFLGHGVGRHRAFGYGALMVVPPGINYFP